MNQSFRPAAGESLVVGLGNPGPEYAATRHNFGFMLLDRLLAAGGSEGSFRIYSKFPAAIARVRIGRRPVWLVKPLSYMNRSGQALAGLLAENPDFDPQALLVAHDDLDLELGRIKLKQGGGSGGHRGVASIIEELGRAEFYRLRLGIDSPLRAADTVDFVLSPFAADELSRVETVLDRAAEGLFRFFTAGKAAAMNELNRRDKQPLPEKGDESPSDPV